MAWNETVQTEIEKTLAIHDPREVITVAVSRLIEAKIAVALYNFNIGGQPQTDPALDVDYNERLLDAALEQLATRND